MKDLFKTYNLLKENLKNFNMSYEMFRKMYFRNKLFAELISITETHINTNNLKKNYLSTKNEIFEEITKKQELNLNSVQMCCKCKKHPVKIDLKAGVQFTICEKCFTRPFSLVKKTICQSVNVPGFRSAKRIKKLKEINETNR